MDHFNRKPPIFYCLILCIFLEATISGCVTVDQVYTSTVDKTKKLISKAKIRTSYNNDQQFALQQFNQNNFKITEFYLKKNLAKFPDNPTAIKLLPWAYFYQKRYDKALRAFKRTKIHYRKNPELFIGMGWCYFGLKNYGSAIEQFEHAEKLGGDFHQISKGKAFAQLKMDRKSDAEKEFSKTYTPLQINTIFSLWADWHKKGDDVLIDIFPDSPEALSLFTLPVEYPRYPSILLGLTKNKDPAIDQAWNTFKEGSFEKALGEFDDISVDTRSPDVKNGLAWSYLKNKEIKIATKLFREILQTWPNFIGALQGKKEIENIKRRQARHADQYFDLNKLEIAEIKYEKLQSKYPHWEYSHIQLGKLKLARKDYLSARKHFLDALDLAPNDPAAKTGIEEVRKVIDSRLFQADRALNSGDYKTAALMYAEYIEEYKPNASSILNFSKTLYELGLAVDPWDEYSTEQKPSTPSVSIFSQILDKIGLRDAGRNKARQVMPPSGSSLAHAYNGLGWSQYHKKKYLQAAKKFKIARADREYFLESSQGLGLALYEAGDFRQAANALKFVVQAHPNQLSLAYKLDMSILMSWDAAAAREYFTKNLVYYPLRSSLYMGLGWLNYRNKNPDLGIEYFLKAISLDPEFALTEEFRTLLTKERFGWQVYNRFGWAYYEKQDYKNAVTMFQKSLKEQPNKSESRKGMGYALGKLGKLAQAAKYLNQALVLNDDPNPVIEMISGNDAIAPYSMTTTARTTLGNIILKQDNLYEAIALFQGELELRPDLAAAHDGLGWAYLKLNHLTESRTAFKAALKYQPLNNLSHKGLREVKQRIVNIRLGENTSASIEKTSQKQ